jgi:hypothetical protein
MARIIFMFSVSAFILVELGEIRTTFPAFFRWPAQSFQRPVERNLVLFLSILVEPYRFVLSWYALSFALMFRRHHPHLHRDVAFVKAHLRTV